jgi:hypothetical protein
MQGVPPDTHVLQHPLRNNFLARIADTWADGDIFCISQTVQMIVTERAAAPREDTPLVSASGTDLNSSLVSCMYGR